jgi:hypothetical protein
MIACIEGQNGLDGDERGGGVDSSEELPGSSEFAASQY